MEATTDEESRRRRREEISYVLYSPCHLCGEFVKAILKCLGFDSTPQPHDDTRSPPLHQESTDTTNRVSILISWYLLSYFHEKGRTKMLKQG